MPFNATRRRSRAAGPRRALAASALGALLLVAGGCDDAPATSVDRETFIRAYTEIRVAALDNEDAIPTDEEREEILRRWGVTADEMVDFVEVHGPDTDYMRALWNEIERRLDVDSLPAS